MYFAFGQCPLVYESTIAAGYGNKGSYAYETISLASVCVVCSLVAIL